MPEHQVVPVVHLERRVLHARARGLQEEEGVVVDGHVAPVAAHEGADDVALESRVDGVGGQEAEPLLVPGFAFAEVLDEEHAVAEALHLRGAGL